MSPHRQDGPLTEAELRHIARRWLPDAPSSPDTIESDVERLLAAVRHERKLVRDAERGAAGCWDFIVGTTEIASLLQVEQDTVRTWSSPGLAARNYGFPRSKAKISGRQLWDVRDVLAWAKETGRLPKNLTLDHALKFLRSLRG